jgi:hypothetical protein
MGNEIAQVAYPGAKSRATPRGPNCVRKLFETVKTHTCQFTMGCSITAEGSYFGDGASSTTSGACLRK